ncbi:hypothetical protein G6F56_000940 [Rhizopus delemar]|uniref:Uncharacterized protein n=1 Tax=Rhizopus stolonifer TaxID=4846 RepID=A0A367KYT7_RHIST|nr:hypothetical protein G6F56_000940 [Rhizopus delemar]RCI07327.1 hypothetical protein CU098_013629 [Rhizopus stolonifer]
MPNETIIDEIEYKKLLSAWDSMDHSNSSDLLLQLFSSYLNHIWIESQNMLHCAQYWQTAQTDMLNFSDAVQTMNSLGLHLMKQSIQTRQDLMNLIQRIQTDDKDTFYSASSISKHEKLAETLYKSPSESIRDMNMEQSLNGSKSLIRLIRSPSAPIQRLSETYYSFQDILPACQYNTFISEGSNDRCQLCRDHSLLKRSYSSEDFQTHLDDVLSDNSSDIYLDDDDDDDDKYMAKKSEIYTQNTFSENEASSPGHSGNDSSYRNTPDISNLSLTDSGKHEIMTDESKSCITPLFEESAYINDTSFPEKPSCEIDKTNMQKPTSSPLKIISSTFFQPLWNIKLVLKKRSQKIETNDGLQTRTKKLVSKLQFKK